MAKVEATQEELARVIHIFVAKYSNPKGREQFIRDLSSVLRLSNAALASTMASYMMETVQALNPPVDAGTRISDDKSDRKRRSKPR